MADTKAPQLKKVYEYDLPTKLGGVYRLFEK